MRLLFAGDLKPGRTSGQRRAAAARLGHEVIEIDTSAADSSGLRGSMAKTAYKVALRFDQHLDVNGVSKRIYDAAVDNRVDAIWLDKVLSLSASTIRALKSGPNPPKIAIYHPDDFASRFNWSKHYNRLTEELDLIVTTKSYNVPELHALGFKNVMFVNKSFDPLEHRPPDGHDRESFRTEFVCDVSFVGGFERDRAELICELARRGVGVNVAGSFWDRAGPLPANVVVEHGDLGPGAYAERIFRTKISLAFLRKQNRDLQTARSFEIPACGGFMLSESTDELRGLFKAGVEAEFFSSIDELHEKCMRYLADDVARETIARAGCRRVWEGRCRSDDVVEAVLDRLFDRPFKDIR